MDVKPKPDKEEKKKPPEGFKREDVEFFDEWPLYINMDEVEDVESFTVFMRPLRVEEIKILNRVTHLQEKDPNCEQASLMLIRLMAGTLSVTGEEVPVGATSDLVARMIEYNFPPEKTTPDGEPKKKLKPDTKDGLVDCFDFLISNGHQYASIMKYPIPVFNNFIAVIAERLGLKKKPVDAAAAFRKLGIPIKPRGNKK